jgi:hypothetical protein
MRAGLALPLAVFGCGDTPIEHGPSSVAPPATASVALAAPSASVSATATATSAKSTQERWGGRIDIPGNAPLMFELRFASDQPFAATMAIPAQKLLQTDLKDVSIAGENMTFTLRCRTGPSR